MTLAASLWFKRQKLTQGSFSGTEAFTVRTEGISLNLLAEKELAWDQELDNC